MADELHPAFDRSKPYPPMPTSEEEWRAHCAFYRLTVDQRDRAWREIEDLKKKIDTKEKRDG